MSVLTAPPAYRRTGVKAAREVSNYRKLSGATVKFTPAPGCELLKALLRRGRNGLVFFGFPRLIGIPPSVLLASLETLIRQMVEGQGAVSKAWRKLFFGKVYLL